ncbi:MAG: tol-pal system YbgF family protein [Salinivirgaceae bacterium]
MSKKNIKQDDNLQEFESALTRTEQFIEDNQKLLSYIVLGALIIVSGYLAFQKFIVDPKEDEARSYLFVAEQYFQKDSFNLALNGDGNYYGFLDIMDEFGMTKTANLSKYYAGISYLHLGDYQAAIDYLKKFKSTDLIISSVAKGAMGDAYAELGEYSKALSLYEAAANDKPNDFSSPIYLNKAAILYEQEGEYQKAIALYEKLKADYPQSQEGRQAEKMIAKAKLALEK